MFSLTLTMGTLADLSCEYQPSLSSDLLALLKALTPKWHCRATLCEDAAAAGEGELDVSDEVSAKSEPSAVSSPDFEKAFPDASPCSNM